MYTQMIMRNMMDTVMLREEKASPTRPRGGGGEQEELIPASSGE